MAYFQGIDPRPIWGHGLLWRFGLPLIAVLTAWLVTSLVPPLAQGTPAALFYGAVTLSALYGGRGAGWCALLLSALVLDYYFFQPLYSLQLTTTAVVQLLVFLLIAGLIMLLIRRMQGTQAQLFTERETLQTTLTSIGDGVITTDQQGNVTYLNPAAVALTGWTLAAAQQQPLAEIFPLIHERTRQPLASPIEEVLRSGVTVRLANHSILVARDGREYPIHDSAAPLRNDQHEITGAVLVFQDDSQRRQAIQQLAKSEARFRALFEQAATGMAQVGLDGKYWQVNQRLCELLGYSSAELLQRTPYELTYPADLALNLANNQRLLAGEIATHSQEKRYIRKDGTIIWINLTVALVRDEQTGAPAYFVAVLEDIDRRKQMEAELQSLNEHLEQRVRERTAELERSNYELDRFAYVASHDLKSPLRGIASLAHWISEDAEALLPATSREHLAKLQRRVKRMEKLLDDLLAYARTGRMRHAPVAVDLAELLANVAEGLQPPDGFVITHSPALPTIMTERIPLELVLRNLIGNAIKHHDRAVGRIEVTVEPGAELITFAVTDDGPGIAPEYHQRIFEMFQTLRPRDQVEGSGIGLAVVKKLVESYGGAITVESQLGQGTTFRFTWPSSSSSSS